MYGIHFLFTISWELLENVCFKFTLKNLMKKAALINSVLSQPVGNVISMFCIFSVIANGQLKLHQHLFAKLFLPKCSASI